MTYGQVFTLANGASLYLCSISDLLGVIPEGDTTMAEGKYQVRCEVIKPSGKRGALFQFEDMDYQDVVELEARVMPILAELAKEKAEAK